MGESIKRARLRLVKGGNSKQLWVHRATSMMPGPPKHKYVRKLVIDAWETGSLAGWHKHVIGRPLADHQMVAFKAIVVWMKLLQQGPPDILVGDAEEALTIIERMQKIWASTMSHSLKVPTLAMLIHRFAVLLMVKFHFHAQHPEYDAHYVRSSLRSSSGSSSGGSSSGGGNSSSDISSSGSSSGSSVNGISVDGSDDDGGSKRERRSTGGVQEDWEKSVNMVSRLLTMIGTSDQLQRIVLGMRARSLTDVHTTTAESCLLPLVQEMLSLVRGAASVMSEMRDTIVSGSGGSGNKSKYQRTNLYNALVLQYTEQRGAVRAFFLQIQEIDVVRQFVDVATLNTLPSIRRVEHQRHISNHDNDGMKCFSDDGYIRRPTRVTAATPPVSPLPVSPLSVSPPSVSPFDAVSFNSGSTKKGSFLTTSSFNSVENFRASVFASFDQTFTPAGKGGNGGGVARDLVGSHSETATGEKNTSSEWWEDEDEDEDKQHDDDVDKFASFSGFSDKDFDSFGSGSGGGFGSRNGFGSGSSGGFGSRSGFGSGSSGGFGFGSESGFGFGSESGVGFDTKRSTTFAAAPKPERQHSGSQLKLDVNAKGEEDGFGFGFIDMGQEGGNDNDNPFAAEANDDTSFGSATFDDSWSKESKDNIKQNVRTADYNPFATGNLDQHIRHVDPPPAPTEQHVEEETQRSKDALLRLVENIKLSGIEIDYKDIQVGEQIGNGAFAVVNRGEYRGMQVAVKHLQFHHVNERAVTDFHTELAVMKSLKHPNIILAMGACVSPVCLVTEFCSNGSLFDVLQNVTIELSGRMKLKLAYDAARGMNFLHTHSPIIIHRDLKSLNLLVDEDWNLKVSDFGLSRFKVPTLMTGQCGTYQWMAPEVVRGHSYTEKADIYSFGINLWEIYTRQIPYNQMVPIQAAVAVMNKGLRPELPAHTPPTYRTLVHECWDQNPNLRPSFDQILVRLGKFEDL